MNYYVDVILPLPLKGTFTYQLSKDQFNILEVGFRIAVSFGMKRLSYDCAILKKKWEGFGEKIYSTTKKSSMDKNEILQYSIVLGLESEKIKYLLKNKFTASKNETNNLICSAVISFILLRCITETSIGIFGIDLEH